jgi:hypothetical protein
MAGVVVEVRVRAPCKRFAIKDNRICDRSARGFEGHNAKLHSFFPLRTMRVVTRVSPNLGRIPSGLRTNPQSLFAPFSRFPEARLLLKSVPPMQESTA